MPASTLKSASSVSNPRAGTGIRLITIRWPWLLPLLLVLLLGLSLFNSTGRDDSYISFWPAYTLAHGRGMVNYTGDRVEMSSSLLWVLLLAASTALTHLPLPLLGPVFSIAFGLLAVVISMQYSERIRPGAGFTTGIVAATCLPLLYWSFGGMETTLAACLYTWTVYVWSRVVDAAEPVSPRYAIIPTALALLVRPEMFLCVAALAILTLAWAVKTRRISQALYLVGIAAACVIAIALFRHLYFGAWIPQTVTAKAGRPLAQTMPLGIVYLSRTFKECRLPLLLLAAVIGAAYYGRRSQTQAVFFFFAAAIYFAFAITAGGDWMEAGRFLVPAMPLVCCLAGTVPFAPYTRRATLAALVLFQLLTVYHYARGLQCGMNFRDASRLSCIPYTSGFGYFESSNRVHLRDMETVRELRLLVPAADAALGHPAVLLSEQMGMPMFSTLSATPAPLTVIDYDGLQDRVLTCMNPIYHFQKNSGGLVATNQFYWNLVMKRSVPEPDIALDSYLPGTPQNDYVLAHYRPYYLQTGNPFDAGINYGNPINCRQAIYVRTDLFNRLHAAPRFKTFAELIHETSPVFTRPE